MSGNLRTPKAKGRGAFNSYTFDNDNSQTSEIIGYVKLQNKKYIEQVIDINVTTA